MKKSSGVKNSPMCSAIIRNRVVETLSIRGEICKAPILSIVWKRSLNCKWAVDIAQLAVQLVQFRVITRDGLA